jgi:acylphosphatase
VSKPTARRIEIAGEVSGLHLRENVLAQAGRLGLLGWVRLIEDGNL